MLDVGGILTSLVSLTVLIVDDSPEDCETARIFLTEAGLEEGLNISFFEASTGEDGLVAYQGEEPDCILLDYYLPDMDGLDFLRHLKTGDGELPLPVVMMTGSADRALAAEAMRAGAQEYLPKRFIGPERLLRAVQSSRSRFSLLIERRRIAAALTASEKMLRLSQGSWRNCQFRKELSHEPDPLGGRQPDVSGFLG